MKLFGIAILACVLALPVMAEMNRQYVTVNSITNAAASSASTGAMDARGLLYRMELTVTSATVTNPSGTNAVVVLDTDNSLIYSNDALAGTYTTNFTTTIPFVGLSIKCYGANTNGVKTKVTSTFLR